MVAIRAGPRILVEGALARLRVSDAGFELKHDLGGLGLGLLVEHRVFDDYAVTHWGAHSFTTESTEITENGCAWGSLL